MKKKPDLNTRVGKYFLAKKSGMTKKDASIVAGYAHPNNVPKIEASKQYQEIERHFKDELLDQITLSNLASELLKNVNQDDDKGAKNKAIEIALSKLEPDKIIDGEDDRVLVVLKG